MKITEDRVDAIVEDLMLPVNAYLLARAHAEVQRSIIDEAVEELLQREVFETDTWLTLKPPERVLKAKDVWLIGGEHGLTRFYELRRKMIRDMGYDVPDNHCPALIAESLLINAEHLIVEASKKYFPGVAVDRLLCLGLESYHRYIDLFVKLCVNHPSFEEPKFEGLIDREADVEKPSPEPKMCAGCEWMANDYELYSMKERGEIPYDEDCACMAIICPRE